jgi:Tfp pilus assembly protein PilO
MANVTLSVTVDDLVNEELDGVESKYDKFFKNLPSTVSLPGKVSDVTETDREEDLEEDEETD